MHYITYLSFIAMLMMCVACGSDSGEGEMGEEGIDTSDTASQIVGQAEIREVEIPQDNEREENLEKAASASPFSSLGCCDDESQKLEDCCCMEVIEMYRSMVAEADTSIGRLKMTDPILSGCRKKHQNAFDEIDYPEGDDDDLF